MLPLAVTPFTKTRLAPTPSGYLHRGNLFSFLLTQTLAKKHKAQVLLRIDDLDVQRVEQAYIDSIFETLHAFKIDWQQGPMSALEAHNHSQQSRLPLYHKALSDLRQNNKVYACSCSRSDILKRRPDGHYDGYCRDKQIDLNSDNVAWRIRTEPLTEVSMCNEAGNWLTQTLSEEVFDFIVKRRDGIPAYQLASVCDDAFFGIDFIVRGQDLFASTLAQLYLAEELKLEAFKKIRFLHHPLLVDAHGTKLSKSAGSESLHSQLLQGISTQQIIHTLINELPLEWRNYLQNGF